MNELVVDEQKLQQAIMRCPSFQITGELQSVQGSITACIPASVGELVEIQSQGQKCLAEVIGFSDDVVQIMPFGSHHSLQRRDIVRTLGRSMRIPVGRELLGRVINCTGEPIDDKGPFSGCQTAPVTGDVPHALKRKPIEETFITGQRAIDGLLTMGQGQRVGLFAGSGVGKSTLLGQIAKHSNSDLNVVALIGERGREVLPFIKEALGKEGMSRSVVVVSTSDESPLSRVRAAESSIAIANHFRQKGNNVLLMLDSLTRFAMAQRDLGLMLGEPPTSRGYTPSVFQKMASLLEQLGNSDRGSITGLLTVLVEGDDMNDPVADTARSILDGHIVMDRVLANAGHFPAIDVLPSASRIFRDLNDSSQLANATAIRQVLTRYQEVVNLVQVGAYQPGVSPQTDKAIELYPIVCEFLKQDLGSPSTMEATSQAMQNLASQWMGAS